MRRVILVGNPNAGKTTLFNHLTGSQAKVTNYPGETVEARIGVAKLANGERAQVTDLPGTYSLSATSPEERLAAETVFECDASTIVVVVVDATSLGRGLYLAQQVAETGAASCSPSR